MGSNDLERTAVGKRVDGASSPPGLVDETSHADVEPDGDERQPEDSEPVRLGRACSDDPEDREPAPENAERDEDAILGAKTLRWVGLPDPLDVLAGREVPSGDVGRVRLR